MTYLYNAPVKNVVKRYEKRKAQHTSAVDLVGPVEAIELAVAYVLRRHALSPAARQARGGAPAF